MHSHDAPEEKVEPSDFQSCVGSLALFLLWAGVVVILAYLIG